LRKKRARRCSCPLLPHRNRRSSAVIVVVIIIIVIIIHHRPSSSSSPVIIVVVVVVRPVRRADGALRRKRPRGLTLGRLSSPLAVVMLFRL